MSLNLANWQQKATASMIVSDGETEQEYRLTFTTCSNLDIGIFRQKLGKIRTYLVDTYGAEWLSNDEATAINSLMYVHAIIMSSLKQVEQRQGDDWAEAKLPESWYSAESFARDVPAGVNDTLLEAVFAAGNSPRLFSLLPVDDTEKKALRLTVRPSES